MRNRVKCIFQVKIDVSMTGINLKKLKCEALRDGRRDPNVNTSISYLSNTLNSGNFWNLHCEISRHKEDIFDILIRKSPLTARQNCPIRSFVLGANTNSKWINTLQSNGLSNIHSVRAFVWICYRFIREATICYCQRSTMQFSVRAIHIRALYCWCVMCRYQ